MAPHIFISDVTAQSEPGAANTVNQRSVGRLLRLEGLVTCAAGLTAYATLVPDWPGLNLMPWLIFGALLLAPDLSVIGYIFGPRMGAIVYNLAHTYAAPALLALAAYAFNSGLFAPAAVWMAHIGLDRFLGYGLKLPKGFHFTHLGPIGAARRRPGSSTAGSAT